MKPTRRRGRPPIKGPFGWGRGEVEAIYRNRRTPACLGRPEGVTVAGTEDPYRIDPAEIAALADRFMGEATAQNRRLTRRLALRMALAQILSDIGLRASRADALMATVERLDRDWRRKYSRP
jgi:hypothetical protein